jgi:hypothetical protein
MTPRKANSLTYPADPLAALRELQDLDAADAPPSGLPNPVPATASVSGSAVGSANDGEESSATSSERVSATRRASRDAVRSAGKAPAAERSQPEADPIAEAVCALLARPYAAHADKGPFAVSTVKIPAEVWERLSWLAKWTGRAKQDIIADALREHFAKVVRGR